MGRQWCLQYDLTKARGTDALAASGLDCCLLGGAAGGVEDPLLGLVQASTDFVQQFRQQEVVSASGGAPAGAGQGVGWWWKFRGGGQGWAGDGNSSTLPP